jgi:hypothetical protein
MECMTCRLDRNVKRLSPIDSTRLKKKPLKNMKTNSTQRLLHTELNENDWVLITTIRNEIQTLKMKRIGAVCQKILKKTISQ